jgi:hypothetical protein
MMNGEMKGTTAKPSTPRGRMENRTHLSMGKSPHKIVILEEIPRTW